MLARFIGRLIAARPVFRQLTIIILFFEIGIVLLVLPWRTYWEQNYFLWWQPWLYPVVTNAYVRGAVSGLGIVNLLAGMAELGSLILAATSGAASEDAARSSVTPHATGEER